MKDKETFNTNPIDGNQDKDKVIAELKQQLESAIQTKNTLCSVIAGELKNPFTALIGLSEFVIDSIDELSTHEIKDYHSLIYNSASHLFNLLQNLLHWSKIQTHDITPNPQYQDLGNLVQTSLNIYKLAAEKKQVKLTSKLPDNIIVHVDIDMVMTVLSNLISNAIKYSNPGGEVIVSCEMDKEKCQVAVVDNGVGMSTKDLEQIMSTKTCDPKRGTDGEKGSGLGLAICAEYIRLNKGTLQAMSEQGMGSAFVFSLPLSKEHN